MRTTVTSTKFFKTTLILAATLAFLSTSAVAQDESSMNKMDNMERISITGSHIKRIDTEGPSPVQTLTRKDLERTGYNSISDVLRDVSASSFGAKRERSDENANPGFSSINLRGLGDNRTLVLLNGKRIAIGSADLNLINMAAVDRIEILKDGASAIYGSDALAGVVNIITKTNYDGWFFEGQQSVTDLEGGERAHISLMGGKTTDKFSGLFVANFRDNKRIFYRDRDWTHLKNVSDFSSYGNPGSYTAAKVQTDDNNNPVLDEKGNMQYVSDGLHFADKDCPEELKVTAQGFGTYCSYNWSNFATALPTLKQSSVLADANYEYAPDKMIYTRMSLSKREINWRYAAVPDVFDIENPGNTEVDSERIVMRYRLTELGDRVNQVDTDVYGFLLGTSGMMGSNWDWSFETNLREQKTVARGVEGFARKSVVKQLIQDGTYRPLDADRGSVAPAAYVYETNNNQRVYGAEAKFSGELMEMKDGPLQLAFGLVGTWEEYKQTVDEVNKQGDLFGGFGDEGDGQRNIQSSYVELSIPLSQTVEAQLAGRVDNYSDFGTTFNPKLAMRWKAQPNLLFRGSVGTGFRAPTVNNLYAGDSLRYPFFVDKYACNQQKEASGGKVSKTETPSCYPTQYPVTSQGNEDLKEEKSLSYNLGTVYNPTKNLSFALDFWSVNLTNSIGLEFDAITEAEYNGTDIQKHGITTTRNSETGYLLSLDSPLLNLAETDIMGADLNAQYTFPVFGKVMGTFRMEASYLFDYKYVPFPGSISIEAVDTYEAPRWRNSASMSFNHTNHNLYVLARTIAGQKKSVQELGRIPNHTEWDLQYKYMNKRFGNLTAGIKNLLGTTPPTDDGQLLKLNTDLYEEIGRYGYLGYSYEFQ